MKKLYPAIISSILAVMLFCSCNKDYICTCTVSSSGVSHVISTDVGTTSKGNAQDKCNAVKTQYTDSLSNESAVCHL